MQPARATLANPVFQDIVESCPFALVIAQGGEFVYVNAAAVALFRAHSEDELLRRSAIDFSGTAKRFRITAADGTPIDVEVSADPVTFNGCPATAIVLRDITERLAIERDLQLTEERFQLVSRATTDAVWDLDLTTGTVWCNRMPGEIFGHGCRDNTVQWWLDQIHADDRPRVTESFNRSIESSETLWSDSYRFRRGDGTYVNIVDRAYIVREANGRAVRMVGSMTDVSELLKAREESATLTKLLEQANRIAGLGRLSATVAHEFNNVLMSIQPHAEIMKRKSGDASAVTKSSEAILQGIQRGKRITEEILRFARPVEPVLAPVVLSDWLPRFAQDVRAVNMPNIELRLASMTNGTRVLADTRQLEQLLWNLVINARDAMPDGGRITIASGVCSECIGKCDILPPDDLEPFTCIRVSDTGHGIPEETLTKIFEPLYTTKKNGTGLGLAVAHQIATRHRGYIFAKSQLGEGATFFILLRTAETSSAQT